MSSRIYAFALLLILIACSSIVLAAPEVPFQGVPPKVLPPRLALVVGIQYYRNSGNLVLGELPDAAQDAEAVSQALKELGFARSTLISSSAKKYIDKADVQAVVNKFVQDAIKAKNDTGRLPILLFYFAGHGFSSDDENYLLPSNFFGTDVGEAIGNSIDLRKHIVEKLGTLDPAIQIIITDSCRSNLPLNLPAADGTSTNLVWGTKNPSKRLSVPPSNTFGRNKVLFLYSTLDGNPAYGDSDHGGRFTQALLKVLNTFKTETVNSSQSGAEPTKPISFQDVYEKVQYDMQFLTAGKWQAPQIDPNRASRFYPFPTEFDYTQEKLSWDALDMVDTSSFAEANFRRMCRLRDLLFKFSEFSYFSADIILALQSAQQILVAGDCGKVPTNVQPLTRQNGKWNLSSPTEPANGGAKPDGRSGSAQNLIRVASSSNGILLASDSTPDKTTAPGISESKPPVDQTNRANESDVKLTFGDVQRAIENSPSNIKIFTGVLPAPDVPLDRAVVTKVEAFLRSGAGPQYPTRRALPAGELLEVLGTSPGGTWLEVRHSVIGSGFISGDLVEPALVRVSKAIEFSPRALEPDDRGKSDLLYTFALLGGAVIVDATAEYPASDGTVGFTRASTAAAFIQSVSHSPNMGEKSRLFIPVHENKDAVNPVVRQTVRVTILCLPLNQNTRAQLAQLSSSSSPVNVQVNQSPNQSPNQSTSPPNTPQNGLVYCNFSKTDCRQDSGIPGGSNSELRSSVQSIPPGVSYEAIKRLNPLFGR